MCAIVVGIAACGGPVPRPSSSSASASSPVAPSGSPAPVCGLVTDFAAAFGRPALAPPGSFTVEGRERCRWIVARDPARSVGLTVGPRADHEATIAALGPGETVAGLGDDARWWAASRTLSVAVGDRSLQVDLQVDPGDVRLDAAVGIARQAVEAVRG